METTVRIKENQYKDKKITGKYTSRRAKPCGDVREI